MTNKYKILKNNRGIGFFSSFGRPGGPRCTIVKTIEFVEAINMGDNEEENGRPKPEIMRSRLRHELWVPAVPEAYPAAMRSPISCLRTGHFRTGGPDHKSRASVGQANTMELPHKSIFGPGGPVQAAYAGAMRSPIGCVSTNEAPRDQGQRLDGR